MKAVALASHDERIGNSVPLPVIESLRHIVGTSNVRVAVDHDAAIVVLPASTDEVAAVVRLCSQHEVPVVPLGGGKPMSVDFQLICATHRQLRAAVDDGSFREDLFYRINGLALQLPPLRERSDLGALVATMLRDIAPGREMQLAVEVAAAFAGFRWPGNLRQLSNVLRTACALAGDEECFIGWCHLPDDIAEQLRGQPKRRLVEDSESDLRMQADSCVEQAVRASKGNMSEAARRLGIGRNTLYRKLRQAKRA